MWWLGSITGWKGRSLSLSFVAPSSHCCYRIPLTPQEEEGDFSFHTKKRLLTGQQWEEVWGGRRRFVGQVTCGGGAMSRCSLSVTFKVVDLVVLVTPPSFHLRLLKLRPDWLPHLFFCHHLSSSTSSSSLPGWRPSLSWRGHSGSSTVGALPPECVCVCGSVSIPDSRKVSTWLARFPWRWTALLWPPAPYFLAQSFFFFTWQKETSTKMGGACSWNSIMFDNCNWVVNPFGYQLYYFIMLSGTAATRRQSNCSVWLRVTDFFLFLCLLFFLFPCVFVVTQARTETQVQSS